MIPLGSVGGSHVIDTAISFPSVTLDINTFCTWSLGAVGKVYTNIHTDYNIFTATVCILTMSWYVG